MVNALKLAPDIRQYVWAPLLVLLVGLTATSAVAWQRWRMAEAKDSDRFSYYAAQAQQNLNKQMEAYSGVLRDVAALFNATDTPGRGAFRAHLEHLGLRRPLASSFQQMQSSAMQYPALLGLGWIRHDTTGKARSDKPAGPRFVLADEPRVRYVIAYLEPEEWRGQVTADPTIFTKPESLAAMAAARDSGNATASARISMIHDFWAMAKSGIHVFRPVYRGGRTPATVAERRGNLVGLIDVSLRTDELLEQAHAGQAYREVNLEVYDGTQADPAALIYRSENSQLAQEQAREPRLTTTVGMDVAGRTWTLVFRSKPEFEAASDRTLIPTVLLIGVLISLLLAGANLFQFRARAALNTSEVRYRRLFEASPDGVFLFDADTGMLTDANPYMAELLGQPREMLIGKALWEIGLFPSAELGRTAIRELQQRDWTSTVSNNCPSLRPADTAGTWTSLVTHTRPVASGSCSAMYAISPTARAPKTRCATAKSAIAPW